MIGPRLNGVNNTMLVCLDLESRRKESVEALNQGRVALEERGHPQNHARSVNARREREGER